MPDSFPLATVPASAYPDGTVLADNDDAWILHATPASRWWIRTGRDQVEEAETDADIDVTIGIGRPCGDPLRVLRSGTTPEPATPTTEVEHLRATVRGLTSQTQAYVDRAQAEGARIVELAAENERLRGLVAKDVDQARAAVTAARLVEGDNIARTAELMGQLCTALEFYADPDTYYAIGFLADQPCGEFIDDFSEHGDPEYPAGDVRPGKRAREALSRLLPPTTGEDTPDA